MNKVYKTVVIESLEDLSNRAFQEVAWFENNQGLSSSFGDDVSAVFEDSALEHALNAGDIVFGEAADTALRELNEIVEAIGYDRDDAELIDAPEMDIVRQKAALALELVKASDGVESTVEIVE